MGSVEEKIDLDFDEEIPFSSSPSSKVHTFDCTTTDVLSPVNLASSSIFEITLSRVISRLIVRPLSIFHKTQDFESLYLFQISRSSYSQKYSEYA